MAALRRTATLAAAAVLLCTAPASTVPVSTASASTVAGPGTAPDGGPAVRAAAGWVHQLHWTTRRVTAGVTLRRGTLRRPAEQVREVIIDPRRYRGTILATHHGAVARRQRTSSV